MSVQRYLFVAGCPRSGTSALTFLLNEHPQLAIGFERFKRLRAQLDPFHFQPRQFFSPVIAETDIRGKRLYERLQRRWESGSVRVIGDKVPLYTRVLPQLLARFPHARVVVMVRDPLEVARSFDRRAADPEDWWPAENDHRLAIAMWNEALAAVRAVDREAYAQGEGERVALFSYEALLSGEEHQLDLLLEFIGVGRSTRVTAAFRLFACRNDTNIQDQSSGVEGTLRAYVEAHRDDELARWAQERMARQAEGPPLPESVEEVPLGPEELRERERDELLQEMRRPGQRQADELEVLERRFLEQAGELARRGGDSLARRGGDSLARRGGDSPARRGGDSLARRGGDSLARRGGDSLARRGEDSPARRGEDSLARRGEGELARREERARCTSAGARPRFTFIVPHQRPTTGGVYVIEQFARHLARDADVRLAVREQPSRSLPAVDVCHLQRLDAGALGPADVLVYPADMRDAEEIFALPARTGRPVMLFQGYGTPGSPVVEANLASAREIVAIARWLCDLALARGIPCAYVPQGLDRAVFAPGPTPSAERPPRVSLMTHHLDWKGLADALQALEAVRRRCPEVEVTLFGTEPVAAVGAFIESPTRAQVAALLGESAVHIVASWEEGFGLTGAEAIACGAALASTDTKGSRDYAIDGHTALVSAPRDPQALAKNVLTLLGDAQLRARLVSAGQRHLRTAMPPWAEAARRLRLALLDG